MDFTVLVVEDYDDTRAFMTMLLRMKGCEVVEAVNGKEAVEIATRDGLGLILMDLNLPVMDGYEATRIITSHPHSRHTPVIAVSAQCYEEARQKALKAGCVDCLKKPLDFEMIDRILALAQKNRTTH
jgi:two-component system cell cycle response regulator DivK